MYTYLKQELSDLTYRASYSIKLKLQEIFQKDLAIARLKRTLAITEHALKSANASNILLSREVAIAKSRCNLRVIK